MLANHSTTFDLLFGGLRDAPPPEPPSSRSGHGPTAPSSWPDRSNADSLIVPAGRIVRRDRLGGLIHEYAQVA